MHASDSPEGRANLAAIEEKLGELDDLLARFCSEHDYTLRGSLNMWPKRRVWCRREIDRVMDLELDIEFQEALDRGFYPDLPLSLYARGFLLPFDPDVHVLSRPIFQHVPHSRVGSILLDSLNRGVEMLDVVTEAEIFQSGETWGHRAETGASPNGGPTRSPDDSNAGVGPPSVS
jgi:hypothetical protein